jgi:hypothetical protein
MNPYITFPTKLNQAIVNVVMGFPHIIIGMIF